MLTERLAAVMVDSGSVLSLELIEHTGGKLFIQLLRYSPRFVPTRGFMTSLRAFNGSSSSFSVLGIPRLALGERDIWSRDV